MAGLAVGPLRLGKPGFAIGHAAAHFSPLSLSPAGWWKADALSLADGDPVATWTDSSGNGCDFAQATSGLKPLYKTAILNGLSVVRFDATDDAMTAGGGLSVAAPYTIFVTSIPRSVDPGARRVINGLGSNWLLASSRDANRHYAGGWVSKDNVPGPSVDVGVLQTARNTGAATALWENGTDQTTDSTPVGAPGGLQLGGAEPAGADIAEVLVYSAALGTTDRQAVEAYLKDKWGTP